MALAPRPRSAHHRGVEQQTWETAAVRTIVVGTDGSAEAMGAMAMAATLAAALGAEVVVVHAVGLLETWADHDPAGGGAAVHGDDVPSLLHGSWTRPLTAVGIVPRTVTREGPPPIVLLAVAGEVDADVIVVGSHGAGSADLYELGSTSAKVVRESSRPVLVVPTAGARDVGPGST
jgi:nucleotide-binding universal stress UspA family protein